MAKDNKIVTILVLNSERKALQEVLLVNSALPNYYSQGGFKDIKNFSN